MKEPKKARRIRDLERMKAKCRRIRPWDGLAKNANHLAVCSTCCGNLRKWYGQTMQERRFYVERVEE